MSVFFGPQVGWGSRPLDRVKTAYENSFLVIAIILKTEKADGVVDEILIGFARATSDHAFNATIWDVSTFVNPLNPNWIENERRIHVHLL
jgi:hypothetical protein